MGQCYKLFYYLKFLFWWLHEGIGVLGLEPVLCCFRCWPWQDAVVCFPWGTPFKWPFPRRYVYLLLCVSIVIVIETNSFVWVTVGKKKRLLDLFGNWCDEVIALISETTKHMNTEYLRKPWRSGRLRGKITFTCLYFCRYIN